jgi:dihydropteroate synthase
VDSGGCRPVGHSRKSLLQHFTQAEAAQRDDHLLVFSAQFTGAGVHSLRVRSVSQHVGLE